MKPCFMIANQQIYCVQNTSLLSPYDINQGMKFIKLERSYAYKNVKWKRYFEIYL